MQHRVAAATDTEMNILERTGAKEAPWIKRVIRWRPASGASGREPKFNGPGGRQITACPHTPRPWTIAAVLFEMLLGAQPAGSVPLTIGILEIISTVELSVTAVYTATAAGGSAPAIDVNQITAKILTF